MRRKAQSVKASSSLPTINTAINIYHGVYKDLIGMVVIFFAGYYICYTDRKTRRQKNTQTEKAQKCRVMWRQPNKQACNTWPKYIQARYGWACRSVETRAKKSCRYSGIYIPYIQYCSSEDRACGRRLKSDATTSGIYCTPPGGLVVEEAERLMVEWHQL